MTKALSGGNGSGERLHHKDRKAASSSKKEDHTDTKAPSRLWAMLRKAQEEMERGADVLGGELSKLWQSLHSVELGLEAVQWRGDRRNGSGGGVDGKTSAAEVPTSRPRLPPKEAAELLAGLGKLQAEMHAEARSFQCRKSEIVNRVNSLVGTGSSRRGRCDRDEVIKLEDEAESMRAAIVSSRSRLLERVRKVSFDSDSV